MNRKNEIINFYRNYFFSSILIIFSLYFSLNSEYFRSISLGFIVFSISLIMTTALIKLMFLGMTKNYTEKQKSYNLNKCHKCTIIISGGFLSNKSKFYIDLCNMCDESIKQYDIYGIIIGFTKPTARQLASNPKYQS